MSRSLKIAQKYIDYAKSAFAHSHFARQQDLADDLRLSRDTISRFFNGKPVDHLNFLYICEKLGLNSEEIAARDSSYYCNLPPRDYSLFIGRKKEIKQLLKYISPEYRQYIAIVEGIGGSIPKLQISASSEQVSCTISPRLPVPPSPRLFRRIIFLQKWDAPELVELGKQPWFWKLPIFVGRLT